MWVGLDTTSGRNYVTASWTAPKNGKFIALPTGATSHFQAWTSNIQGLSAKVDALFGRHIEVNNLTGKSICLNCLQTNARWTGLPSEISRFFNIKNLSTMNIVVRLATNLPQASVTISTAQGVLYILSNDTYIIESEVEAGTTYQAEIEGPSGASGLEMLTCCVFVPYKE